MVSSLTVEQAAESWYRSLEAANRAPVYIASLRNTIRRQVEYMEAEGLSTRLVDITRRQMEDLMSEVLAEFRSGTAKLMHTHMKMFFAWCVAEEELEFSPMARIQAPKVEEQPPTMLTADEVRALLKTCVGKTFMDRRDRAILLLLIDTGMRLHEIVQLRLDSVDLKANTLAIIGKGRRPRMPHFDRVAADALDAYLRARIRFVNERPRLAADPALWLGQRGGFRRSGIAQMLKRRAQQAGISTNIHPHLFRHGFANDWLAAGGTEGDLARLAGWKPGSAMLHRYGAAQAEERAREAHKRLSPANRLVTPERTKK